jgi:rhodanese-related sulfurtransferase
VSVRWGSLGLGGRLAVLALVLGAGALVTSPRPGTVVRVDTVELGRIVQGEVDHVEPQELAAWIVAGRSDYRLIDLRDESAFAAYHIPGAERVPVGLLAERAPARNERVILYSDGGIHAAQAWFLLRALGHEAVYTLRGGLDGWKDEVLYPQLGAATAGERAEVERRRELALHFGGAARGPSDEEPATRPALPPPPVVAPPAGAVPGAAPAAKKRKEGC